MFNQTLYCFWFGEPMSDNRQQCFDSIVKDCGVTVKLVTEDNLKTYIVEPLHRGFQYLSATHKSDYLRSYFMYFHGGGYTDIKQCDYKWDQYFDELFSSNKDFISCTHTSSKDIAYAPAADKFNKLPGAGSFIFKPQTQFAKLWLDQTNLKMDSILEQLINNPGTYHPRAITGGVQGDRGLFSNSQYPLKWNELLGQIFHRLAFENPNNFLLNMPYPNTRNYR